MSEAAHVLQRVCDRPIDDPLAVIRPPWVAALAIFMSITLPGAAEEATPARRLEATA